jgi:DNA-binding transcriptional regulator GbsR (MarR family)
MPASEAPSPSLLRVVDTIGGLIELWGFKRNMGRMWAMLYLTPTPLSASDLGELLAMSAGAVSMTLAELSTWGVVKKTWIPGDRRDYYEPEPSIWKMVSRVYRERELAQIRAAVEVFTDTLTELGKDKKKNRFVGERIETLLNLARLGETLLAAILDGQKIDLTPIRTFFAS